MRGDRAPELELASVDACERMELDFAGEFCDWYSEGRGKYDGRENNEYVDVRLLFKEYVDARLFKECVDVRLFKECVGVRSLFREYVDARLSFEEYTEEG